LENWVLKNVEPLYRTLPGWAEPIQGKRDPHNLPTGFEDYVRFIEDELEVEVALISTGPGRRETILLEDKLVGLVNAELIKAGLSTVK